MLKITIPKQELWDDASQTFNYIDGTVLSLEHSLISVSKWESIWHKPFLSSEGKTREETISYIQCMTITQNVKPEVYLGITNNIINEVNKYISDSMTATWFTEDDGESKGVKKNVITSELIYYWMIAFNIPSDYEKWHLNRLMTLIHVCKIKKEEENGGQKKASKDYSKQNASLMAARRAKLKKH